MTKWMNILSNAVYPIAGWYGDWFTFVGGIILAIGSGWMHYEDEILGKRSNLSILADWIGMYAFFIAIIALHSTIWAFIILPIILMLGHDMRSNILIGMVVLAAIFASGFWWAMPIFLLAVGIRFKWEPTEYQDYSHATWHILTGIGAYLIIL